MTLKLNLSPELAERLEKAARGSSRTPEQIALAAIERNLTAWERLDKCLAPVHAAFEASGLTEDELTELLEAEKHAMRREHSGASGQ
jgi:predicted transcriptional regulator